MVRFKILPLFAGALLFMLPGVVYAQASSATTSTPTVSGTAPATEQQLPVTNNSALPVTNDAPPVDAQDPLSEFRKANEQPAASPATNPPVPTPGGFQQPANGTVANQAYNLQDIAAATEEKQQELQQKARENAFDAALNGMMPLSPEQIRTLLDKYKVTRQASEERIGGTPKPEITVQTVSLEPGVAPPIIKLSPGHVTSLDILDMTGQPWPVQDVSWGGNFEVINPGEGGHVIRISPMGATEVGNLSVLLVGLKTPVTFELQTQLDVVQYRFDARIPEMGPLATPPLIEQPVSLEAGSDKVLTQVMDGVPPAGTEKLALSGVDSRTAVYRSNGIMYLRTPLTLLSPGWSASVKSADGTTVYVVNNSPVFLLSDRGQMVRAAVEEQKAVQ